MALEYKRLSDRILFAFELAVEQEDMDIAEALMKALDKAITRSAGGKEFTERRDLAPEYQAALSQYEELKEKHSE